MEQVKKIMVLDSTVSFAFDEHTAPAAYANSGDTVVFRCQDCYAEQIDEDGKEFALLDMKRNNPITGPLFVNQAEVGDVLKVEIQEIEMADYGVMCVRTGCGIYDVEGCHCRRFPIRNRKIFFDGGIQMDVKPMIGVIGTCPAGPAASTQSPGEHGGNLDIRELGEGSILYLPVSVPGALLSLGDLHAVQGDGETAICGMEMSGTVSLRVTVIKQPCHLPTPMIETASAFYTTSADVSLDVCSVAAARKMHHWLIKEYGLSDAQAAMLLSLQGNLRISQVVNPLKGCFMEFPKSILAQIKEEIV